MTKKRLLSGLRPGDRLFPKLEVHFCFRLSASIFGPGGHLALCDFNLWLRLCKSE